MKKEKKCRKFCPFSFSTTHSSQETAPTVWGVVNCKEEECMAWVPEQPCRGGPFCLVPARTGNMPCETCCYAGEKTIPAHCKLIGVK